MRHVEKPDENSLKVRKPSKGGDRKTSLAELIPDWPVLSQRKTKAKVHILNVPSLFLSKCSFLSIPNIGVFFN